MMIKGQIQRRVVMEVVVVGEAEKVLVEQQQKGQWWCMESSSVPGMIQGSLPFHKKGVMQIFSKIQI
jgi:hypothetical protein